MLPSETARSYASQAAGSRSAGSCSRSRYTSSQNSTAAQPRAISTTPASSWCVMWLPVGLCGVFT